MRAPAQASGTTVEKSRWCSSSERARLGQSSKKLPQSVQAFSQVQSLITWKVSFQYGEMGAGRGTKNQKLCKASSQAPAEKYPETETPRRGGVFLKRSQSEYRATPGIALFLYPAAHANVTRCIVGLRGRDGQK